MTDKTATEVKPNSTRTACEEFIKGVFDLFNDTQSKLDTTVECTVDNVANARRLADKAKVSDTQFLTCAVGTVNLTDTKTKVSIPFDIIVYKDDEVQGPEHYMVKVYDKHVFAVIGVNDVLTGVSKESIIRQTYRVPAEGLMMNTTHVSTLITSSYRSILRQNV